MKKARWSLLAVIIVVALTVVLAPAAAANPVGPPVLAPASGVWTWTYVDFGISWESMLGGWTYDFNNAERGVWTGTFRGTSVEPWSFYINPDGDMWALITIDFRGKVAGHRGTAQMALTVEIPANSTAPMSGSWAVQSGKGGLKHLFGIGTWVYDEAAGHADYTGAYWLPRHGDPDHAGR